MATPGVFKVPGARLSYPQLFKAKGFGNSKEDPKFSAVFILDKVKDAKLIKELRTAIDKIKTDFWGAGKVPSGVKSCLHDGVEKEDVDGYGPGIVFVNTSSSKKPLTVGRQLDELQESDDKLYAGCYVVGSFRLWVQDNEYGKRVNAELRAVQFMRDGERFSDAAPVVAEEEFEALPDDDDGVLGGEDDEASQYL